MIKRKRNRVMALGGALAVAGCSGGGTAPAPVAKPAQTANHTLSTVKLTINPTLLRHASSRRRRPAFLDPGNGETFAGTLSLLVTSQTNDGSGLAPLPTTQAMTVGATGPITLSVPLYGPSGFIRIQEVYQSATLSVAPQLIADTEAGGLGSTSISAVMYAFTPGVDSFVQIGLNGPQGSFSPGPITLNAVVGGVVVSDTPDGSSNAVFVPDANPNAMVFLPNSNFIFVFAADATGGFTPATVPGGFPNPVNVTVGAPLLGGLTVTPTITPGAFVLGGNLCGFSSNVTFDVVDGLNNHESTAGTGYLNMNGNFCL